MSDSPLDIMSQMNSIDLSTVETEFPIPQGGIIAAQIHECEPRRDVDGKKGQDAKPYIFVSYNFTQPWMTQSVDGSAIRQLLPGSRGASIQERIYVGTYEDKKTGETKWYGIDRLAKLREAVLGKAQPGTKFDPSELRGQDVTLKLLFEAAPQNKDTKEVYGPRTSVAGYIRKK